MDCLARWSIAACLALAPVQFSLVFLPVAAAAPVANSTVVPEQPLAAMRMPGEFEPVSTVVISEDVFFASDHSGDFLREILAARAQVMILVNDNVPAVNSILYSGLPELSMAEKKRVRYLHLPHGVMWVRDFGPLAGVWVDNPAEPAFADMKFDSPYTDVRAFAGRFAERMKAPARVSEWPLDGGNFLSDGTHCYVGSEEPELAVPAGAGDVKARRQAQWGKEVGCASVRVINESPHEHIDMFVKILSPRHALVGEIPKSAYRSKEERNLAEKLELVALQMKTYMNVSRIPMPEPTVEVFRTYTNSILVNGHAIVPRYELANKATQRAFESQTARAYEAQGYAVRFINADQLIKDGGAWHCVTLQLFGKPRW